LTVERAIVDNETSGATTQNINGSLALSLKDNSATLTDTLKFLWQGVFEGWLKLLKSPGVAYEDMPLIPDNGVL